MSRQKIIVSKQSEAQVDEDIWLKRLEKQLNKTAVTSKEVDKSVFDQINAIMNGKSKYSSVEQAVEDMQERSGLKAYLDKLSHVEENRKIASDSKLPSVMKECPSVKTTFENYIRDTKGNMSIPAIIDRVRLIHRKDVSDPKFWDEENLLRYVSKLNLVEKQKNPDSYLQDVHLGKETGEVDPQVEADNSDAFIALNISK